MERIGRVTLIGTSHIAQASVVEVKQQILTHKPKIVAVELDRQRYASLMEKRKKRKAGALEVIRQVGFKGFLFSMFGAWAEKKLGKIVGTSPGAEMKQAIRCAQQIDAKVVCIDQDIRTTLRRISETITWREKRRLARELLGFCGRGEELDLRKTPPEEVVHRLVEKVKRGYPSLYRVLIKERDEYMAQQLKTLCQEYRDEEIIAVVGAGHVAGISHLLRSDPSQ